MKNKFLKRALAFTMAVLLTVPNVSGLENVFAATGEPTGWKTAHLPVQDKAYPNGASSVKVETTGNSGVKLSCTRVGSVTQWDACTSYMYGNMTGVDSTSTIKQVYTARNKEVVKQYSEVQNGSAKDWGIVMWQNGNSGNTSRMTVVNGADYKNYPAHNGVHGIGVRHIANHLYISACIPPRWSASRNYFTGEQSIQGPRYDHSVSLMEYHKVTMLGSDGLATDGDASVVKVSASDSLGSYSWDTSKVKSNVSRFLKMSDEIVMQYNPKITKGYVDGGYKPTQALKQKAANDTDYPTLSISAKYSGDPELESEGSTYAADSISAKDKDSYTIGNKTYTYNFQHLYSFDGKDGHGITNDPGGDIYNAKGRYHKECTPPNANQNKTFYYIDYFTDNEGNAIGASEWNKIVKRYDLTKSLVYKGNSKFKKVTNPLNPKFWGQANWGGGRTYADTVNSPKDLNDTVNFIMTREAGIRVKKMLAAHGYSKEEAAKFLKRLVGSDPKTAQERLQAYYDVVEQRSDNIMAPLNDIVGLDAGVTVCLMTCDIMCNMIMVSDNTTAGSIACRIGWFLDDCYGTRSENYESITVNKSVPYTLGLEPAAEFKVTVEYGDNSPYDGETRTGYVWMSQSDYWKLVDGQSNTVDWDLVFSKAMENLEGRNANYLEQIERAFNHNNKGASVKPPVLCSSNVSPELKAYVNKKYKAQKVKRKLSVQSAFGYALLECFGDLYGSGMTAKYANNKLTLSSTTPKPSGLFCTVRRSTKSGDYGYHLVVPYLLTKATPIENKIKVEVTPDAKATDKAQIKKKGVKAKVDWNVSFALDDIKEYIKTAKANNCNFYFKFKIIDANSNRTYPIIGAPETGKGTVKHGSKTLKVGEWNELTPAETKSYFSNKKAVKWKFQTEAKKAGTKKARVVAWLVMSKANDTGTIQVGTKKKADGVNILSFTRKKAYDVVTEADKWALQYPQKSEHKFGAEAMTSWASAPSHDGFSEVNGSYKGSITFMGWDDGKKKLKLEKDDDKYPEWISDYEQNYSELKEMEEASPDFTGDKGHIATEKFEAMAGTPTTKNLYFASGGKEYLVQIKCHMETGKTATREYTYEFLDATCKAHQDSATKTTSSSSAPDPVKTNDGEGGEITKTWTKTGDNHKDKTETTPAVPATEWYWSKEGHECNSGKTVKWSQKFTGLKYFKIDYCKVWKLTDAYTGIEEGLTDTEELKATIQSSEDGMAVYNRAKTDTAKDGRMFYSDAYTGTATASNLQTDAVKFTHNGFTTCAESNGDKLNENMKKAFEADMKTARVTPTCISDYLVLETTKGDQAICYFEYTRKNPDDGNKGYSIAPIGGWESANNGSAPDVDMGENADGPTDSQMEATLYYTMNTSDVTYSGYNGSYNTPETKYSSRSTYATPAMVWAAGSPFSMSGLSIVKSGYQKKIKDTNGNDVAPKDHKVSKILGLATWFMPNPLARNGEYKTSGSSCFYKLVVDDDPKKMIVDDTAYQITDTSSDDYEGPEGEDLPYKGFGKGSIFSSIYREKTNCCNDIVIHDPVSCQYACILGQPEILDQRTDKPEPIRDAYTQTVYSLKKPCGYTGSTVHGDDCYEIDYIEAPRGYDMSMYAEDGEGAAYTVIPANSSRDLMSMEVDVSNGDVLGMYRFLIPNWSNYSNNDGYYLRISGPAGTFDSGTGTNTGMLNSYGFQGWCFALTHSGTYTFTIVNAHNKALPLAWFITTDRGGDCTLLNESTQGPVTERFSGIDVDRTHWWCDQTGGTMGYQDLTDEDIRGELRKFVGCEAAATHTGNTTTNKIYNNYDNSVYGVLNSSAPDVTSYPRYVASSDEGAESVEFTGLDMEIRGTSTVHGGYARVLSFDYTGESGSFQLEYDSASPQTSFIMRQDGSVFHAYTAKDMPFIGFTLTPGHYEFALCGDAVNWRVKYYVTSGISNIVHYTTPVAGTADVIQPDGMSGADACAKNYIGVDGGGTQGLWFNVDLGSKEKTLIAKIKSSNLGLYIRSLTENGTLYVEDANGVTLNTVSLHPETATGYTTAYDGTEQELYIYADTTGLYQLQGATEVNTTVYYVLGLRQYAVNVEATGSMPSWGRTAAQLSGSVYNAEGVDALILNNNGKFHASGKAVDSSDFVETLIYQPASDGTISIWTSGGGSWKLFENGKQIVGTSTLKAGKVYEIAMKGEFNFRIEAPAALDARIYPERPLTTRPFKIVGVTVEADCGEPHHHWSSAWYRNIIGVQHVTGEYCIGKGCPACAEKQDFIFADGKVVSYEDVSTGGWIIQHDGNWCYTYDKTMKKCPMCNTEVDVTACYPATATDKPIGPASHYDTNSTVCWDATEVEVATEPKATIGTQAEFILLDKEFDIYFPNTGDFYGDGAWGIPDTTVVEGKGFKSPMDVSEWTAVKCVKFDFDVIYEDETYVANTPILLYDKSTKYGTLHGPAGDDIYHFYCPLANDEAESATAEFSVCAMNAGYTEAYENGVPLNYDRLKDDLSACHDGIKEQHIQIVGRIGALTIEDTGDWRFSNLFKQPVRPTKWLVNGTIKIVDPKEANYVVGDVVDIRGNRTHMKATSSFNKSTRQYVWDFDLNRFPVRQQMMTSSMLDTYGVETYKQKVIDLPLTPAKNNIKALRKQPMRNGYAIYSDISTIGNYFGVNGHNVVINPYYYVYDTKTQVATPVDVYMLSDNEYKIISEWGLDANSTVGQGGVDFKYYLDWEDEYERRNYGYMEEQIGAVVLDYRKEWHLPSGSRINLGNAQRIYLNEYARTFNGTSWTNSRDNNPGSVLISSRYNIHGQKWHFTLGLPSSVRFVEHGKKPTNINFKLMEGKTKLLITAIEVIAYGEVWSLRYNDPEPLIPIQIYPGNTPECYLNKSKITTKNGTPIPVITITTTEKTSRDDLVTIGTH